MHGKNMDGARDPENQHLHLAVSPQPFPHVDPTELAYHPGKKKAKARLDRRFDIYKEHHKSKKNHYDDAVCGVYTSEIQENAALGKKFLETKAKKTKKEKGDKNNAKKNDVLSVSVINDENRSAAAYHRGTNNVPSVNGGSPGSAAVTPVKNDQFDRDLPHSNGLPDQQQQQQHDVFSTRFLSTFDVFPDLLAGAVGSLDELLPGDDPGLASLDVGNMLDEMNNELSGEWRQQVENSLDFFQPDGSFAGSGHRGDSVKMESQLLDEFSSFTSADVTGTAFSARSAHLPPPSLVGLNSPHLTQQHHQQRITPDSVRSAAAAAAATEAKRMAHEEANQLMMLQQTKQQQHHNMLMQHQQQQRHNALLQQQYLPPQSQQKSVSPFGGGGGGQHGDSSGAQAMCFSPVTQQQAPSDLPAGYPNPNAHNYGLPPGAGGRGGQPGGGYEAGQMAGMSRQQQQQVMRMNQGSPGAVGVNMPNGVGGGGRWPSEGPLIFHQKQQMSLAAGAELPGYGTAQMQQQHSAGQMPGGAGGPGKPVFHQGSSGYPPNQMTHRSAAQGLPGGPYGGGGGGGGYVNGNNGSSMPRPPQLLQQYRGMMPNGGGGPGQPGMPNNMTKMYPGGGGGGNSYAGHMQQQQGYQQNVMAEHQASMSMRQMTAGAGGYRPGLAYNTPQQPVQVQQQQQQSPNFMTSSNMNPAAAAAALQQQQQQQAQQSQNFYAMQQNGFPGGGGGGAADQMHYQQQQVAPPDGLYAANWPA